VSFVVELEFSAISFNRLTYIIKTIETIKDKKFLDILSDVKEE